MFTMIILRMTIFLDLAECFILALFGDEKPRLFSHLKGRGE